MNWLDIVILVIIAIPTFIGLRVGIVKTLLILVGGIVGIVLAGRFSTQLGDAISSEPWANILAFAIILLAVLLIAAVIAKLIKWVLSAILLGWVNRLGGAILGFVLGAFFCAAILTMWVNFQGSAGDTIKGSPLASFLVDGFPFVLGLLPPEFDGVQEFFN